MDIGIPQVATNFHFEPDFRRAGLSQCSIYVVPSVYGRSAAHKSQKLGALSIA